MSPVTQLTCPSCGNINPNTVNTCLKCGLNLVPIKEALIKAGVLAAVEGETKTEIKKKFTPRILPKKDESEDLGAEVATDILYFPGKFEEKENLISAFVSEIESHQIPNIEISYGELVIEKQARNCVFAQIFVESQDSKIMGITKNDKQRARSTIAVRIDASGKDLILEWRNFLRKSVTVGGIAAAATAAYFTAGISLLAKQGRSGRALSLKGYENPDNDVFAMTVFTALKDAIEDIGLNIDLAKKPVVMPEKKKRII